VNKKNVKTFLTSMALVLSTREK